MAELDDLSGDCADCNSPSFPNNFVERRCCQADASCAYMPQECRDAVNGAIATGINECDNGGVTDGACCLDGGNGIIMSKACCNALGGTFRGARTSCTTEGAC